MLGFCVGLFCARWCLVRAGSGCPGALLRVPRAARSSFTYAEHPDSPIPANWYSCANYTGSASQRQGGGTRQSEVKEEAAGRGTRTAAGTPTLLRAQQKMRPLSLVSPTAKNLVLY